MLASRHFFIILTLGLILSPSIGQSEEPPRARPYRPTLSNPAQLPVPGYLEVEAGWQSLKEKERETYRHNVPYLLKFAFSDRIGLLIGGDAIVANEPNEGSTMAGFGDLTPTLKINLPIGQTSSAIGVEGGVKFPTAPGSVGSKQTDYVLNGIYSTGIGPLGIDLNFGYTRLGGAPNNTGKDQIFWAASAAYQLTPRWSVAGEFAGTARQEASPFTQFLASTSYVITPRIVTDTGMAFGLNHTSQAWTAFAGLTFLVGKIL